MEAGADVSRLAEWVEEGLHRAERIRYTRGQRGDPAGVARIRPSPAPAGNLYR
jgi:hypothetical protein